MKDWQRSPEPPSMMGPSTLGHGSAAEYGSSEEHRDPVVDDSAVISRLAAKNGYTSLRGGKDAKLSLTNMCKKIIMRNLHAVQDLGDMPFRVAKDILDQCRVDQLIMLEEASPHLQAHTDQIWKRNCLRDFVDLRKKYEDGTKKESSSWRKAYLRKKGELEEQKEEAKQRIKDRYASHRAEKDAKKLVVSDRPLMKARSGRKVGAFGTSTAPGTKGQSLIMKARSGSAAAARLTGGGGNNAFRPTTVGRARAVGSILQPAQVAQRPMVAPKRVSGQSSRLKEAIEWNQKNASTSDSEDSDVDRAEDRRGSKRARAEPPKSTSAAKPQVSRQGSATANASPAPTKAPSTAARSSNSSNASSSNSGNGSGRRTIDFFGTSRTSSTSLNASSDSPTKGTKRSHSGVTITTSKMARIAAPTATSESSSDDAPSRRSAVRPDPNLGINRPATGGSLRTPSIPDQRSALRRTAAEAGSLIPPSPARRPPFEAVSADRQSRPSSSSSSSTANSALPSASAAAMSSIFMPRNHITSQRPRS
ncbi:hypothetical protein ACQY0O_005734 [Thecaphora frezii]